MRRALLLSTLLGSLAAGSCGAYTVSFENKDPFAPLPVYEEWWAATETCSGRSGDLLAIDWYTAASITSDNLIARGLWSPPHEIVIVRGYEEDELTVRHEMLHDLLGGDSEHESALWEVCELIPS